MAEDNKGPISGELYQMFLKELERLNNKLDDLSDKLQNTNQELTKISGFKYVISDLKEWKSEMDKVTSAKDIEQIQKDMDDMKAFKTRAVTIGSIITFILTSIIALVAKIK